MPPDDMVRFTSGQARVSELVDLVLLQLLTAGQRPAPRAAARRRRNAHLHKGNPPRAGENVEKRKEACWRAQVRVSAMEEKWFNAVASDKRSVVSLLLDDGADVNARLSPSLRTALHVAIDMNMEALVDQLLTVPNINVNIADVNGLTPLHLAASFGHTTIVEKLLAHGAAVDAVDSNGLSSLHSATFFGRLPACDALIAKGANSGLVSKGGKTALSLAEDSGNFLLVGLLKKNTKSGSAREDELPPLEPMRVVADDMPALERAGESAASKFEAKAKPVAAKKETKKSEEKPAVISSEIVGVNADTMWTPTDTYSSLKKKLDLANAIIGKLKK